MATTNFVDEQTVIEADWLNDVDEVVYTTVPSHTSSIATNTTNISNKAEKGANSDITSLTGLTTPLTTAQGGTGFAGPCGFYANPTSDQTGIATAGSWVNVDYGTEVYDLGTNFASSTFTAPASGYYTLSASLISGTSLNDGTFFSARFNGSTVGGVGATLIRQGAAGVGYISISWVGRLALNETVRVQVLHNLGSNIALDAADVSGNTMHFSGHRLG